MENLKERWNAKTPKFWKKVQRIGLVAGAKIAYEEMGYEVIIDLA